MSLKLPYRATTATGVVFDIEFPLHADTGSAVRVSQLIAAVLEAVDRDIAVAGETSNGDVMQAVAMALAIRAGMVHADKKTTDAIASGLVRTALEAMGRADRSASQQAGHA